MKSRSRACSYRILVVLPGLFGICLLLSAISIISNRSLPEQEYSELLSSVDEARLLESLHLKAALGDQVWQSWDSLEIPVIVWNRSYEFLFDYTGIPPAEWSLMTNDEIAGKPYWKRKAVNPQNFAVQVGDSQAASIATKNTTDVFLIETFRDMFPSPIKQVFPYRFLLQPSETQMAGLLHETFHVYQYYVAPARMDKAESIHRLEDEYEAASKAFNTEWKQESEILATALQAKTQEEQIDLVRQFLTLREARRNEHQLSAELLDYERCLEWEEGTAKYIELAILKVASRSTNYQPLPEMQSDPDFMGYRKIDQRWSQEIFQLRYQTSSGETQFYMTGMAQAFLLDDLMPNWKEKYWQDEIFLETLLEMAIAHQN